LSALVAAPTAVSLFSSSGIGDLGLFANGINVIASSELIEQRHAIYRANFPSARCFTGDVWGHKEDLVDHVSRQLRGEELFLVLATPPCQGMSTNGVGKLLAEVKAGNRAPADERNRLIIPTMDVVTALRPKWLILENVPTMRSTTIVGRDGEPIGLLDFARREIGPDYVGASEVVSCSDYGVPQVRKRLITIFTRDPAGVEYFHRNQGTFRLPGKRTNSLTLRQAIGHLPSLDPYDGPSAFPEFHPLHYVQKMSQEKHWWIKNTPEGETAFNNQCVAEGCGYAGNAPHVDKTVEQREVSGGHSALFCEKCGSLLPRPSIVDERTGERRLIKGFHSAYRRMRWDEPARALTRNFPFEASDNKIHPDQHRPLSIYEAMVLQTITKYDFNFEHNGKLAGRKVIADVIGESVPPLLIDVISRHILAISTKSAMTSTKSDSLAA
jgi:DNA (cytosine-5)-methyltransferase 1